MLIKPITLIFILLIANIANGWENKTAKSKGVNKPMETYYIGRFSIAVPNHMIEAQGSRSHQLRHVTIEEIVWPEGNSHEAIREAEWKKFIITIEGLIPPEKKKRAIIRERDFLDAKKWAKGVFYYNNSFDGEVAKWSLLMDEKPIGVWLKSRSAIVEKENASNKIYNNFTNIARSYRTVTSKASLAKGHWFYLKHGAINLPYSSQEESDVRFEDHALDLTLRIQMHETYAVEKAGLMDKTIAAIVSGYAGGLKIKKIRSQKRTVAGLNGEEEVLRQTENEEASLNFVWEYNGKPNSGEHPRIVITMDTPDGNLNEKLKIWDDILDSMKPMFEQNK